MKKILLILSLLLTGKNFGQDTIIQKNNPIIFGELLLGYGGNFSEYTGIIYGGNINYQIKKHFFTARYMFHPDILAINLNW